jgi:hypothetical protein
VARRAQQLDRTVSNGRERILRSAVEAAWGCRLSYARLKTPVDPESISEFDPHGNPNDPWVYDWYSHVLFASQLFEASRALVHIIDDAPLTAAFAEFAQHWEHLAGLRNVLLHPTSREVDLNCLSPFGDRLEYREPGRDPDWVFQLDQLHDPVERLFAVLQQYR